MQVTVWDTETWVYLKEDPTRAVKIFTRTTVEPGPNELAELTSQTVGLFRRTYQEWGNGQGRKVTERRVGAPPSSSPPATEGPPSGSPSSPSST